MDDNGGNNGLLDGLLDGLLHVLLLRLRLSNDLRLSVDRLRRCILRLLHDLGGHCVLWLLHPDNLRRDWREVRLRLDEGRRECLALGRSLKVLRGVRLEDRPEDGDHGVEVAERVEDHERNDDNVEPRQELHGERDEEVDRAENDPLLLPLLRYGVARVLGKSTDENEAASRVKEYLEQHRGEDQKLVRVHHRELGLRDAEEGAGASVGGEGAGAGEGER